MIKKLLYSLLFLIPLSISAQTEAPKAQENIITYNNIKAKPGEMYVDNVKVDPSKTFLDHDNFKDVKVIKSEADKNNKQAKGATFITRKSKPKLFKLSDLVNNIKAENDKIKDAKTVKVVVDGREIKNPGEYMIERSVIKETAVKADSDVKKNPPTITITTKNKKK
jgi:hypothetical protein